MDADLLERSLYKNELTFNNREERKIEFDCLRNEGIKCEDFKTHDETGRPVFGIRFPKGEYDLGIISQIENKRTS